MAGEITDPSGRPLVSARTEAEKLAKQIELVEKRAQVLNLKTFAKQISESKVSAKEMEEILTRTGGKAEDVAEELKKISTRTGKTKGLTKEWAGELGNVSERLLGISLSSLTITAVLAKAVNTTVNWYNHTFEIKRQMYDINAALGEAGTKGLEFEEIISNTALAFHAQFDEVRNVADGLADIGMNGEDIKDTLDDVFALTRMWSDVTPEKQMSLMSDYMKEFGMNGKEAWATMNALYVTSQDLRKDLPNLDIQKFVDQTQSVALSMRKYGLETQDAIAMTSTLARLGVEQARIPEIAETISAAGFKDTATTAYMAQTQLLPKYRAELKKLKDLGVRDPEEQERMDYLGGRLAVSRKGGVLADIGLATTATAEDKQVMQQGFFRDMLSQAGVSLGGSSEEKIIGALAGLDLPGIGKMNIQAAREFAKAAKARAADTGKSFEEEMLAQYSKTVESEEAKAKEAEKQRADQIKKAEAISDATIKTSDKLKIIAEHTGNMLRIMGGDTAEEVREIDKAKRLEAAGGYVPTPKFKTEAAIKFEQAVGMREITHGITEIPSIPSRAAAAGELPQMDSRPSIIQHELIINPTTGDLLLQAVNNGEVIMPAVKQLQKKVGS